MLAIRKQGGILTFREARKSELHANVILMGDAAHALRTLVVKLAHPKEVAAKIRDRDFSDQGPHPFFRPVSRLDIAARRVVVFDIGAGVEGPPVSSVDLAELTAACKDAITVVVLHTELDEARLRVLRWVRQHGVGRIVLVTNAKLGAVDLRDARARTESLGFTAAVTSLVEGELKSAAVCRCGKQDCARCRPWNLLSQEMVREGRNPSAHMLGAEQAIGYGMKTGAFVVETTYAPLEFTVGTRVNVLMPGKTVAAAIEEVTDTGYVFTSREVDIKRVAGIASMNCSVKVGIDLEVEPVAGPVPHANCDLGASYLVDGTAWEVGFSLREGVIVVHAGAARDYDKSKRWLSVPSTKGRVPLLYEEKGVVALRYPDDRGGHEWMIGRVRAGA